MLLNDQQLGLVGILELWILDEGQRRDESIDLSELTAKARALSEVMYPGLEAIQVDQVVIELTRRAEITQRDTFGVQDTSFSRWLDERRLNTATPRWDSYAQLLRNRNWAPKLVRSLDSQTDAVVELLGDPDLTGVWHRRGLLMGDVQSGKTATYLGVLNKAIDYGYKLIVIIGGHTNDLRSQTQARVDSDLTGKNSTYLEDHMNPTGEQLRIGIAKLDRHIADNTTPMTTVKGDFNASARRIMGVSLLAGTPTVFVIKKNVRSLEHVQQYIAAQAGVNGFDLPILVVDDEADWGSPNTNNPELNPTRVNAAIRLLLNTSSRSSYLAVTATPFANALIDHSVEDDLFPVDYIRALGAPSNYMGTHDYFGELSNLVRVDVDDCLSVLPIKHKKEALFDTMPESMKHAIRQFVIGTAIRRVRTESVEQASMMINVSRFNDVQRRVGTQVSAYLAELQTSARTELRFLNPDRMSQVGNSLRDVLNRDFPGTVEWPDLVDSLGDVIDDCAVSLVNNRTAAERNKQRRLLTPQQRREEDLTPKIYVGGDVLSRGLTLGGLQVSYFVREPRSSDTLLQMARWFGYRPGYNDLVRVWMPEKTRSLFVAVAEIVDLFRDELREMEAQGMTPRQFGLKILLIPEIAIVAANKRRAAQVSDVRISLHGRLAQTVRLGIGVAERRRNQDAIVELLNAALQEGEAYVNDSHPIAIRNVPNSVIAAFFEAFAGHPSDFVFGRPSPAMSPNVVRFLPEVKGRDAWRIAVVSGNGDDVQIEPLQASFPSTMRNQSRPSSEDDSVIFANNQVGSPMDLSKVFNAAGDGDRYGDKSTEAQTREVLDVPVLLLYATTRTGDNGGPSISGSDPLWALRVFFPKLDPGEELAWLERGGGVKFLINSVAQAQFSGSEPESDYEEEVDD